MYGKFFKILCQYSKHERVHKIPEHVLVRDDGMTTHSWLEPFSANNEVKLKNNLIPSHQRVDLMESLFKRRSFLSVQVSLLGTKN